MKSKVIHIERYLRNKYKSTSKNCEDEKLNLCDRCRRQERWRKENEDNRRQLRTEGSDISMG